MGDGKNQDMVRKFFIDQGEWKFFNPPFSGPGLIWLSPEWLFANGRLGFFNGFEKTLALSTISLIVEKR